MLSARPPKLNGTYVRPTSISRIADMIGPRFMPPYSSGVLTPQKPALRAFRRSSRSTPGSTPRPPARSSRSTSGSSGMTSFWMNARTVSRICRSSSVREKSTIARPSHPAPRAGTAKRDASNGTDEILEPDVHGALPRRSARQRPKRRSRSESATVERALCLGDPVAVALLDAAELPDQDRADPGEQEHADDDVAEHAEVQLLVEELEEPALPAELGADHLEDLDGADEQGDRYRQAGGGDVVPELAQRAGERPPVSLAHQRAVGGVHQAHAGGEQQRQRDHRPERHLAGGDPGGERQQADLAGGVEAKAEQQPQRVHLPGVVDQLLRASAEDAVDEAALQQEVLEVLAVVAALLHMPPDADDLQQHDQVEHSDGPQEHARHAGADGAPEVLPLGDARLDRLGGERQAECQ